MIDPVDLTNGDAVLIRAVYCEANEEGGGLSVLVDGPRPPFTRQLVLVADIEALARTPDAPVWEPRAGDRVRDERGREFELVDIKQRDDKAMIAMLWSADFGADWAFLEALEHVSD